MIPPTQEITDEERQCKPKRYKLDLLQDPSVTFLYKLRLSQKLTRIDDSTSTKLYDGLVKSIQQTAEKSLGELDNGRNKKSPYWWNDSIKESIEEKKRAYNKWLTTKDSEDRKYHTRISREVKKEIIRRKNEFWDAKCDEVDQHLGSSKSRKS
ncbi:hypothetical protein HHI36_004132 [Cryptolaemus montrouzieri]|uniref:Uncharacterized protein n=1 Tax=Cryptolaemus montrouzieri TaxID=559131 RepID=A0ABD2NQI5_9CUCU